MRSHKVKWCLVVFCLLTGSLVQAEEEAAGSVMKALPKEQKEFYEKTQRLNTLTNRIEEAEKSFHALVRQKAAEKNPTEIQNILKQMLEVTKERNKNADEYNKTKSELALRYPNQGEHLNRHYEVQAKKTVEELEGAAGLDELLTRTKKIVERKYAPFADPNEVPEKPKAQVANPSEEKTKRLKLEK